MKAVAVVAEVVMIKVILEIAVTMTVLSNLCFISFNLPAREVAQSCPTLCDPTDCSLPGSSVHGIFQARILEWAAIFFFKRSSRPRV